MINETKALELVIASGLKEKDGKWMVNNDLGDELIQQLHANKDDLMWYMRGECFCKQARVLRVSNGIEWVVSKVSAIGCVSYPPVEVFAGSANDVDLWCRAHSKDPLFTDKCTSKYVVGCRNVGEH